ncbi:MAG: hypothetical protein AVDCRST_MAG40-2212, partial [uncultured Gemmatimonadaceae bacterium]
GNRPRRVAVRRREGDAALDGRRARDHGPPGAPPRGVRGEDRGL